MNWRDNRYSQPQQPAYASSQYGQQQQPPPQQGYSGSGYGQPQQPPTHYTAGSSGAYTSTPAYGGGGQGYAGAQYGQPSQPSAPGPAPGAPAPPAPAPTPAGAPNYNGGYEYRGQPPAQYPPASRGAPPPSTGYPPQDNFAPAHQPVYHQDRYQPATSPTPMVGSTMPSAAGRGIVQPQPTVRGAPSAFVASRPTGQRPRFSPNAPPKSGGGGGPPHRRGDIRRHRELSDRDKRDKRKTPPRRKDDREERRPPPPPREKDRYTVRLCSGPLVTTERQVTELRKRYPDLYIAHDFTKLKSHWVDTIPSRSSFLPIHSNPVLFEVQPSPNEDIKTSTEPATLHNGVKHNAKVLLFSRSESDNMDDPHRAIRVLLGKKDRSGLMCIGGSWTTRDGGDPTSDDSALIRTAIRSTREFVGIELSSQEQKWTKLLEIWYHRPAETYHGKYFPEMDERTVIFIPDTWNVLPESLLMKSKEKEKESSTTYVDNNSPKKDDGEENVSPEKEKLTNEEDTNNQVSHEPQSNTSETSENNHEEQNHEEHTQNSDTTTKDTEMTENSGGEKSPIHNDKNDDKVTLQVATSKEKHDNNIRAMVISLEGMLDYEMSDTLEKTFEVSLAAEALHELLQRDCGLQLLEVLKSNEKIRKKKRSREKENKESEQSAKKIKTKEDSDVSTAQPPDMDKEENTSTTPQSSTASTASFDSMLSAFKYFDRNGVGYLRSSDIEDIIFSLNLGYSRGRAHELVGAACDSRSSKVHYREIVRSVASIADKDSATSTPASASSQTESHSSHSGQPTTAESSQ